MGSANCHRRTAPQCNRVDSTSTSTASCAALCRQSRLVCFRIAGWRRGDRAPSRGYRCPGGSRARVALFNESILARTDEGELFPDLQRAAELGQLECGEEAGREISFASQVVLGGE